MCGVLRNSCPFRDLHIDKFEDPVQVSRTHLQVKFSPQTPPPPPAPRPLATTGSDRGFLTLDRHLRIDLKVHILLETFFSVSIYVDFFLKSVFRFQRDPSMTLPKKMLPLLKFISYHAIHFCFFLVFMKYNSRISYIIKYLIGKIYPIISPIMNIVLSISQHP